MSLLGLENPCFHYDFDDNTLCNLCHEQNQEKDIPTCLFCNYICESYNYND